MNNSRYIGWFIEFVSITAISVILTIQNINNYWLILPIIIIVMIKVFEYRKETSEKYQNIHSQLKLLYAFCSFDKENDVRCVFHAPVWFGKLIQTAGYIPTGSGKGRIFNTKKGIIGKSYSHKMTFVENFSIDDEYRNKMKSDYGYSEDEIKQRTTDRRSYLCLPFIDDSNHKVIGLVYFDSSKPGFFQSIEDTKVQEIRTMLRLVRASIM